MYEWNCFFGESEREVQADSEVVMWYKVRDKWGKERLIKTVFVIRNNREMTELMQEKGLIGLQNEVVSFVRVSWAKRLVWRIRKRGGAVHALV